MEHIKIIAIALVLVGLASMSAVADVVVVVSSENPTNTLSRSGVANIFLGRANHFPSGERAVPVDQREGREIRNDFYRELVGWTPAQLKGHWSKLVFTGRGRPPAEVKNDNEVKKFLGTNPNAIGYIDESNVSADVKMVDLTP